MAFLRPVCPFHRTLTAGTAKMALDEKEGNEQGRKSRYPQPPDATAEVVRFQQPDDETFATEVEHNSEEDPADAAAERVVQQCLCEWRLHAFFLTGLTRRFKHFGAAAGRLFVVNLLINK